VKKWYASKTLWVQVFSGIASVALLILQTSPVSPEIVAGVIAGLAAVNGFLRTITTESIG